MEERAEQEPGLVSSLLTTVGRETSGRVGDLIVQTSQSTDSSYDGEGAGVTILHADSVCWTPARRCGRLRVRSFGRPLSIETMDE